LEKLEPFGEGNERPLWLVEKMEIISSRTVGNGSRHLKLELKNDSLPDKKFKAIGFGLAKNGLVNPAKAGHGVNSENLSFGDKIDIVTEIIVDEWNGTRNLQLKIADLKRSE